MCPKRITAEDLEPSVGGIFDDFDSPVIKAKFGEAPAKYQEKMGGKGIGIYLTFDQKFTPNDGTGERNVEQFYSIGSTDNWEIKDNGKEVVNVKNADNHRFNQNTNAWAAVDKMVSTVGNGDFKKGSELFVKRDNYMTEAAFYTGLNYHWKLQKIKNPVQGTEHDVLLPDKFLGEVKVVASASSGDLDTQLVELAHGRTTQEVKKESIKAFKGNSAFIKAIVSGSKLKELEDAGEIVKDEDGKYI